MNSAGNTPSKPIRRTFSKNTAASLLTPGRTSRHQFIYRRQNRLLRSELASLQGRCLRMERTITELNAQLALQIIPEDRTDLQKSLTAEKSQCELLQFQLAVTRRENGHLRETVTGLAQELVHQKQLREDHLRQQSVVAVNSKTEILKSKLQEAFRENGLLKVKIEELEKVQKYLVRRHRTSLTNIKSTADELVSLIDKEWMLNLPEVIQKKFENVSK